MNEATIIWLWVLFSILLLVQWAAWLDRRQARRFLHDPRTVPGMRGYPIPPGPPEPVEGQPQPLTGRIYKNYFRYPDGVVVNNDTGEILWPNENGDYPLLAGQDDPGLKMILEHIKNKEHEKQEI